jgi:hypothetical protein
MGGLHSDVSCMTGAFRSPDAGSGDGARRAGRASSRDLPSFFSEVFPT